MAAKGSSSVTAHGVKLDTLKDCLQFLEWLEKSNKVEEVTDKLMSHFEGIYNNAVKGQIVSAISTFLTSVSKFLTKLCTKTQAGRRQMNADQTVRALLECIPKVLAALYFLRYKVDENFKALGGGDWAEKWLGYDANSYGGDLARYLYNNSNINVYHVICGGFSRGEVKYDYKQAKNMAPDLTTICEKKSGQFFRDVFVTSVLVDNSANERSNAANALALVSTLCQIVAEQDKKGKEGGEVRKALVADLQQKQRKKCICWQELKDHCKVLQNEFSKIFNTTRFSFTGYKRGSVELSETEFARRTADWLRKHLTTVKNNLINITPFDTKFLLSNRRFLHTGNALPPNLQPQLEKYFTTHLFPYGFTFEGNHYKVESTRYEELFQNWREALEMLKNDGLSRLKIILDGKDCPIGDDMFNEELLKQGKPKLEVPPAKVPGAPKEVVPEKKVAVPKKPEVPPAKVPEAPKEVVPEKKVPVAPPKKPEVPPAKVPEAPKEVVPEKKVAVPKKPESPPPEVTDSKQNQGKKLEGTQNQGKRAEGAQNQGKKAEGAQNQGKKAEGALNEANGQSDTTSPSSQVAQAVQTQDSSVQSPDSGSSGALGPGSGRGPGAQAATSGAGQTSGQEAQPDSDGSAAVSPAASPGPGVGGDRAGGDSGGKGNGDPLPHQCKNDNFEHFTMGDSKYCVRKATLKLNPEDQKRRDDVWQAQKRHIVEQIYDKHNSDHPNRQILRNRINTAESRISHTIPSHPSRPVPGPSHQSTGGRDGHGRPYYETAEGRGRHDDGSMAVNQPSEFDGQPIPDTASKVLQEKIKKKVEGIKFLKSLESTAQLEEVEQLTRDEVTVNTEQDKKAKVAWEKRKQQGKGVKKHYEDLDRIQKTLQRSNRANEARLKQEDGQRKFIEAAPQLDGSQPSDDIYGERWPWWYPGLLYREVTGKPIDDDLPERLQDQRERLFHEKIQDDLGRHIDERKELKTLEREAKDQIEKHDKDAEEKLRQGRIQHMQLNPPITTVLPPLPDPRELPDTLKHPDITFKVVDDTDRQSFAQKSKDAAQRIKDYYEKQRQRVEDEKKVYTEELVQKEKNATQAHVENIKRAKDIVQSEILQKKFHGGDFDIALAPSLTVDDFEENAHEAYRIYGPSPKNTTDEIFEYNPKWDNVINYGLVVDPNPNMCNNPWKYVHDSTTSSTPSTHPDSDHLPPPTNVKAMLFWLVGFNAYGLIAKMERHMENILNEINGDAFYPKYALQVTGDLSSLSASHIADTLTEACLYSAHILNGIMRMNSKNALGPIDFRSEYSKFRYSPDPACLLCQLRDYVYAAHHQLEFLKAQCNRDKLSGGWESYEYGSDIKTPSPLQAFLTDGWDSTFETHLFDPCNLCHKSRVRMGFNKVDLPDKSQLGGVISTILTPSCGGSDPLLTLCSYLNCLTRRTPRTTGELVSYFHHFGNSLHDVFSKSLSPLGSALSESHPDCPDWDHLDYTDLAAVRGIRGHESLISKHNSNHDEEHPRTLSTLVGCSSDSSNCPQHCSPITYRAYAMYSQSFAHTYLSWAVYLPDRLWESLQKLYNDMIKYKCSDGKSLYSCSTALPLLYTHGFTPPEGQSQPKLTCSDVIAKLQEIVNGKPIADLISSMDNFLYDIREPFIFTLVALWSLAFLIFANTMLYRIDILHIRSHLIRTKASHLIDVKAVLSDNKKMMSLYDASYFDDDPNELLNLR